MMTFGLRMRTPKEGRVIVCVSPGVGKGWCGGVGRRGCPREGAAWR